MRIATFILGVATAVALASLSTQALAQGKAVQQPESDRPSGIPGSSLGGRDAPADDQPPPAARDTAPAVRDTTPTPPDTPPAPPVRWNSVASAIWRVRGRVQVAIGYSGTRSSSEDARSSAIDACVNAGGRGCKALGAWSGGCVYITTGHATNRAGWASGATADDATRKCRADGFSCKQPIGGCLD
jgi:Domain of unknown function (DUF4189)